MPFLPRHAGCSLAALLTVGFLTGASHAEAASPEKSARADVYTSPLGDSYFALVVPPVAVDTQPIKRHVILVDTSASQVGVHRTEALAILDAVLKAVPAGHEVALVAVDVKSQPLTDGFAPAGSAQLQAAREKLDRRMPAGATNLAAALVQAADQFDAESRGSILYIGDGMSAASLVSADDLATLLESLRTRQVPVHSYIVGPNRDLNLLGILGTHSGGLVQFDQHANTPAAGLALAGALAVSPVYPTTLELDGSNATLIPGEPLPLRPDRDTVYLGRGDLPSGTSLRLQLAAQSRVWNVAPTAPAKANAYIAALYQRASERQIGNPMCGTPMLVAAHNMFDRKVDALVEAGVNALATRDAEQAQDVLATAEQLAPHDDRVRTLLASARNVPVKTAALQVELPAPQQPPAQPAPGIPADAQPAPDFPADAQTAPELPQAAPQADPLQPREGLRNVDDLLADEQRRRTVRTQRMQLEVSQAMDAARTIAATNPEGALSLLKSQLNSVNSATDINPEVRDMLARRLRNMIADVQSTSEAAELNRMAAARRAAVRDAQRRLQTDMREDEQILQDLINEVRGYIDRGRHGDDNAYTIAERVAEQAVNVEPFSGAATAAQFTAEAANQLNNAFRWRTLRADRFLETMEQVEISHVPIPDEPPIRWPPTPVWRALSERRKVWASVDLAKRSPREERIEAVLDDPTIIDFLDTPLSEVVTYLAEQHDIPIILDPDLADSGIQPDEIVNRTVQGGISLRAALKIILSPLELTYVIEDEVMKIVSEEKARDMFSTRVYPVGDLVIPIQTQQGGAGALGGGLGGAGAGIGGGGLGGFGGGLGGGGLFSVPTPAQFKNPQPIAPQAAAPQAQVAQAPADDAPVVFDNRFVTDGKKKPNSRP